MRVVRENAHIPADLGGSVGLGDDQIKRAELGDLCAQ
jgi:hypothetical protein